MNIMAKGLQKRETKLRIRMNYKNVKSQQKGDYKNVKNSSWGERYFLFLCKMPCYAGSRVSLCKTGVKQFESGKIGILDNVGTVFAANKSA